MRGKPATIGLAVVVSRIELSRKEGEEERSGEKEKERGQGVYLVVGFKRAKLSFSSGVPTREDLSSWGHSRLSLSLSLSSSPPPLTECSPLFRVVNSRTP